MPRPRPTPVFHFTRVEHLPTIIRDGLIPDNDAQSRGVLRKEIGNHQVKKARRQRAVSCGDGMFVADYVPFYFAPRSPMMYSIYRSNVPGVDPDMSQLAYLGTYTQTLQGAGLTVVYSDQNARAQLARLTTDDTQLEDDSFIDWPLMKERFWNNTDDDPNRKERRQAECLVRPKVAWNLIHVVAVKTNAMKEHVNDVLLRGGAKTRILVRPDWYF